ncbi:family 20 glycosylhydrolase [Prolixibacteraceae bacterium]|nr:family 20 glycosylhydrolase [Prolixibacteraceae bacterium]
MKLTISTIVAILTFSLMIASCKTEETKSLSPYLLPKPQRIKQPTGYYTTSNNITISSNTALLRDVEKTASKLLKDELNINLKRSEKGKRSNIRLLLIKKEGYKKEGYQLKIDDNGIFIQASSTVGIFYGIQSLSQLIEEVTIDNTVRFKKVDIIDYPYYNHRGLFLDACTHFYNISELKKLIRAMSYIKLNKLTFGIINTTTCRIEIKSRPEFTQQTAWRKVQKFGINKLPKQYIRKDGTYGGYYTQQELHDLIRFAKKLNVEIIPHVEINGTRGFHHRSYPFIRCKSTTSHKRSKQLCMTNHKTINLWSDLINNIANIFESDYIHIGGGAKSIEEDELCQHCLDHMRRNNMNNTKELEHDFFTKIESLVNSNQKKLMGWNNVYSYAQNSTSSAMVWQSSNMVSNNIKNKHQTIIGIERYYSLTIPQNFLHTPIIQEALTTRDVYEYNPNLSNQQIHNKYINGLTATIWTFKMYDFDKLTYNLFPRLFAIAENAWYGPTNKDWDDFNLRQKKTIRYLTKHQIQYGEPCEKINFNSFKTKQGQHVVLLSNDANKLMRYTLDGSEPNNTSFIYKTPITIVGTVKVTASIDNNLLGTKNAINYQRVIKKHKAIMANISYKYPYSSDTGKRKHKTLVNGILDEYLAMEVENLDFTIDLQKEESINFISTNWLIRPMRSIYEPTSITYYVSTDGINYRNIFQEMSPATNTHNGHRRASCYPGGIKARYIHIIGENRRKDPLNHITPIWFKNPDKNAWLNLDEVIIE